MLEISTKSSLVGRALGVVTSRKHLQDLHIEIFLISEYSMEPKSDKYRSRGFFSLVPTFYASSVMACRFYGFLRGPLLVRLCG